MGKKLTRDTLGDRFSEVARLMWAQVEAMGRTQADVARLLGVHQSRVHRVMYGLAVPSPTLATQIQDEYGVPADAWGRPPVEPFAPPASRAH